MRRLWLWLFLAGWAALAAVVWATGDWNAYYDIGRGPEVKFRLTGWEQAVISALLGAAGSALGTGLIWAITAVTSALFSCRRLRD
jgi:hypothetical protein